MNRFSRFVTERFSLVFMVVLAIGVAWESAAYLVQPTIAYLLMLVIYLGFLRVDLRAISTELCDWKQVLRMLVLLQLVIPAGGYFLMRLLCMALGWDRIWADGCVLILAAPAGAVVPTLTLLMHGRFERGVLLLVATAMVTPLTMPLMLWLLLPGVVTVSPPELARFLAFVLITPAVAATATRRFLPKAVDRLHPHVPLISVLALCAVIVGAVAGLRPVVFGEPVRALQGTAISTACMVVAFIGGWLLGRGNPQQRMTLAIAATWTNIGLSIVTANKLFADTAPLVVLAVTLGEIPWNALFPPGQWFANRFAKSKPS